MKGKWSSPNAAEEIEIDVVDVDRECPHFKHALSRQDGHFLVDEIDHIRVDLEILLSASVARIHNLQEDLEACEAGGVISSKSAGKPARAASGKARFHKASDFVESASPLKKRAKSSTGRQQPLSVAVGSSSKSRAGKLGEGGTGSSTQPAAKTPSTETARLLHSKAVDRFWSGIEPYCGEISQSVIKGIEDYIANFGRDASVLNGSKSPPPGKPLSLRSSSSTTTVNSPRVKGQNGTNLGPLTRRLVAALLEDSYAADSPLTSSTDQFSTSTAADGVLGPPPSSIALARALDLGNTVSLERRVRRILEKHDIFDSSDSDTSSGDEMEDRQNGHRRQSSPTKRGGNNKDEVSAELVRCQEEMKTISESNRAMLTSLATVAKSASQVGTLRNQLSNLEYEIEEAYQRVMSSKQRKKAPNVIKREREQFQRLLGEWRRIASQLEQLS